MIKLSNKHCDVSLLNGANVAYQDKMNFDFVNSNK